ncbi:MAG: tryptophan--tRNA ligase [bacterium]
MDKKIVFSGVQPTGNLHIGNYLGAISQWVNLQNKYTCIFCVVDYHAITVDQNPKELHEKTLEVAKIYLAAGINPRKSIIFRQSDIKEHVELTWLLNCTSARISDLNKMTQFKDKISTGATNKLMEKINKTFKKVQEKKYKEALEELCSNQDDKNKLNKIINNNTNIHSQVFEFLKYLGDKEKKQLEEKSSVGLFDYPVLMAADILLYNSDIVPVGNDQSQHVELTRTLANRFNYKYGNILKIPEAMISKSGARIMGLDDASKKMSKSASSPANYIALTDSPAIAKKKIMKAQTDSDNKIKYDPKKKPAISNLLTIFSLLSGQSINKLEKMYSKKGYGDFKKDLANVVEAFLVDFQKKYAKISNKEVESLLKKGAKKLRPIAQKTVDDIKTKIGI